MITITANTSPFHFPSATALQTRDAANSVRDIESYLRITAPFDGVVTERNVDRGSLVGPSSGSASTPMLRLQQITRLRLIVPVPEDDVAGVTSGSRVNFTVPAFPGENFAGMVQRVSHMLRRRELCQWSWT